MAAPDHPRPACRAAVSSWARWLFPAGVAVGLIAYWALGGSRFSLEELQAQREELQASVNAHFPLAVATFLGVATLGTALCLPVTALLGLAAGALFGLWLGTALISVSTTLGATCAFLLTRYLFHDFVQQRWGRRLEAVHRGLERDGAYYLLTLRLVPGTPFFAINPLVGLTRIHLRDFWWATLVGMLPSLAVAAYAGVSVKEIHKISDVLSPPVALSLTLIAVVPLLLRLLVYLLRRRQGVAAVATPGEKTFSPLPQGSEELS